eukprot:SAG31_NODE_29981_length_387_cov_0.635417_1_plen_30_part_10
MIACRVTDLERCAANRSGSHVKQLFKFAAR